MVFYFFIHDLCVICVCRNSSMSNRSKYQYHSKHLLSLQDTRQYIMDTIELLKKHTVFGSGTFLDKIRCLLFCFLFIIWMMFLRFIVWWKYDCRMYWNVKHIAAIEQYTTLALLELFPYIPWLLICALFTTCDIEGAFY